MKFYLPFSIRHCRDPRELTLVKILLIIYSLVVFLAWKGNSDRGLIDCEYSGKGGQRAVVGVTSVL